MTLVDTNVLLDLVTNDPLWADWSVAQLEAASLAGPLLINDVIYAELAIRYERIEELDAFIEEAGLELISLPRAALFLAGKVFTDTAGSAVRARVYCRTFSLVHRPPFSNCPCSHETSAVTGPISPQCG